MAIFNLVPQLTENFVSMSWSDPDKIVPGDELASRPSRVTTIQNRKRYALTGYVGQNWEIWAKLEGPVPELLVGASAEIQNGGTLAIPVVGRRGDLAVIHYVEEETKLSLPLGWFVLASPLLGVGPQRMYILTRLHDGFLGAATIPLTIAAGSAGSRAIARMFAIRNHQGQPVTVVTTAGTGTTVSAPALTAPGDGYTLGIGFVGFDAGTTLGAFGAGGWAEVASHSFGPLGGVGSEVVKTTIPQSGTTTGNATLANSTDWAMVGFTVGHWGDAGDPDTLLGFTYYDSWFAEAPSFPVSPTFPVGYSSRVGHTPTQAGHYTLVVRREGAGAVVVHIDILDPELAAPP